MVILNPINTGSEYVTRGARNLHRNTNGGVQAEYCGAEPEVLVGQPAVSMQSTPDLPPSP
ncbi:hypothetical protein J6590_061418 [Homalodisca vitripennis]|nr:hypothetical protein J6590_061418 [Homalodisca vitripennis]